MNLLSAVVMEGQLTPKQREALELVKGGANVFLTGPAGTGKSKTIEAVCNWAIVSFKRIRLTALTGVAACLIGGRTLHSWGGLGLAQEEADELVRKMRPKSRAEWYNVDILVVDEVSMLSSELLEKIDIVSKKIRKNTRPMGGIQVLFSGDFAQLSPVRAQHCFKSPLWGELFNRRNTVNLTEIIRQPDPLLAGLLNRARLGRLKRSDRKLLNSRIISDLEDVKISVEDSDACILPTRLYPHRKDVEEINQRELNRLVKEGSESRVYQSIDNPPEAHEDLNRISGAPHKVRLAEKAQVMLTRNIDTEKGLVNGSRGVLTRIKNESATVLFDHGMEIDVPYIDYEVKRGDSKRIIVRSQIPLIPAWAITIHKCQGATISNVATDLSNVFCYAQSYVTLSRVRSIEGLYLLGIDYNRIECNPDVKKFYRDLEKPEGDEDFPRYK